MLRFDRSELLGRGGFGDVFKGVWNDRAVAVKQVLLEKTKFHREDVLKHLDHPNVIKLLHTESDGDLRYWVLELCIASLDQVFLPYGNPQSYQGPRLPHHSKVLLQLAMGLAYVHSQHLFHGNISPTHVLISLDLNEKNVTMKWSGFTIFEPVDERGECEIEMERIVGTSSIAARRMKWMAPELLDWSINEKKQGTVKSDVFAEGLLFAYYLGGGVHPYGDSNLRIPFETLNIATIIPTSIRNSEYGHIIEKMLTYDVPDRMTSSDVVEQLRQIIEQQRIKGKKLLSFCSERSPDLEAINKLIREGVDVNCKNNDGWNALLLLCRNYKKENLIDIVRLLIENGIDVKCQNNDGWNALHLLCRHYENENLIDIIQLLIQYGISINCQTSDNKNALSCLLFQRATPRNLTQNVTKVLIRYGICITKENVTHELTQLSEECTGDREHFTFMENEGITLGWHLGCESCQLIRAIKENSRKLLQHHQKVSNTYIAFHMIVDEFIEEEKSKKTLEDCYLDPTELIAWLRRRLQHCLESIEPCIQTIEEICQYLQHLTNSSMHFNCDKYEEYLRSMHLIAESIGAKETMNQIQWFYLLPFDYRLNYDKSSSISCESNKEELIQTKMEWDETLFSWAHKPGKETIGEFLKEAADDNSLFIPTEFSQKCHGQA